MNGNDPKFDIRNRHTTGEKEDFSKGITLTDEEAKLLNEGSARYPLFTLNIWLPVRTQALTSSWGG